MKGMGRHKITPDICPFVPIEYMFDERRSGRTHRSAPTEKNGINIFLCQKSSKIL